MKQVNLSGNLPDLKKGFAELKETMTFRKLITPIGIVISFFIFNYFISSTLWGGQDFFVNWSSARMLFFKNINPYSQNGMNLLIEAANAIHVIPKDGQFLYLNPLYSIFIYFPFSLVPNFILARTIWLVFNELLLFYSCKLILRIIGWQNELWGTNYFIFFSFCFFYSIMALLQGSEYIMLFFIFLVVLQWISDKKILGVGVLLSILTFKPQFMLIPLIVIFIYLLREKSWGAFAWLLISLTILGVASYLLIPDWPIMYLRQIVLNGIASGMGLPGMLIKNWINNSESIIWNGIAVLGIGVIVYELFFSTLNPKINIWVICLAISMTPLIMIQNRLGVMCFLLLPLGFIFQQWKARNGEYGSWLMKISFFLFSFLLFFFGIITQSISYKEPFSPLFYFLPIGFTLLNLYWIRGWLMNDLTKY